jgi:regulator of sigma E protease
MALDLIVRIVEFVIALGILIFLHELGHYLLSKAAKIEVEEFGFGFPPRLFKLFTLGGTDFTINAIPFGAFVRPRGENDPNIPGGMSSANPWKRFSILIGGPLMNLVTGVILFSLVFSINGVPQPDQIVITDTNPGSPAEMVGLQPDDLITAVNGEEVKNISHLAAMVQQNAGHEITITIQRGNESLSFQATPRKNPPAGEGALGITMSNPVLDIAWPAAVPYAIEETAQQGAMLFSLPVMLITGQIPVEQARLVSFVGMFSLWQSAREIDVQTQASNPQSTPVTGLAFLATISVALGFTNLLPLPALDGGRIIFLIPEILFRRRVPAEKEAFVHMIGFFALILLMIVITAQDIINPIVPR